MLIIGGNYPFTIVHSVSMNLLFHVLESSFSGRMNQEHRSGEGGNCAVVYGMYSVSFKNPDNLKKGITYKGTESNDTHDAF
jgi:hypothetical protein